MFRGVLGSRTVTALLDYVAAREQGFIPAKVRDRGAGRAKLDYGRRECLLLGDLGELKAPIETFVRQIAPDAVAQLGLIEPYVEPREFEISAHGDGGHFEPHLDTVDRLNHVRILSCVYYFAATPRRFTGGELRLYGFPKPSGDPEAAPPYFDVAPETDTLVAFPSWLRHEVRPTRVPSGAWADYRFAINCWIHRVMPAA